MTVLSVPPILEGIPLPVVVLDAEGRIEAANSAARAALGDGLVGRLYIEAFRHPDLSASIEAALQRKPMSVARYLHQAGGAGQVFRVTVSPLPQGAICTFEDVSAQEQVGQMRRDFVANVSHELRSPLTALLGFIETLQGAARTDPAARERFLAVMAREAGRMNRLVGDLLSLSRVEAQERMRPTQVIDLTTILARVVADLRPISTAAKVVVKVSAVAQAPVPGDSDQIVQVMTNLIENAIKYGGNDKTVQVELRHDARDPVLRCAAYCLVVVDQGDGIDAIHLPRLTERFYRVDPHRSREKGGTGLGLAIVKHIVSRHRGRLLIASERGVGSSFSVVLPAADVPKGG